MITFEEKVKNLFAQHEELITRKNEPVETHQRCVHSL